MLEQVLVIMVSELKGLLCKTDRPLFFFTYYYLHVMVFRVSRYYKTVSLTFVLWKMLSQMFDTIIFELQKTPKIFTSALEFPEDKKFRTRPTNPIKPIVSNI